MDIRPVRELEFQAHSQPLYRQLYLRLKESILTGSMTPGQRLASSRALASQLGMARNTVLQAYMQLEVEGYIVAERGSGHFVSRSLPHASATPARPASEPEAAEGNSMQVPQRFEFVPASLRRAIPARAFRINLPELRSFPIDAWMRLHDAVVREYRAGNGLNDLLGEADPQGDPGLRRAIADHVSIARGIRCRADTVIITAGAQHAMDMLLRTLTQPGDAIGLEDPCFPGALSVAQAAHCRVMPLLVDREGALVGEGPGETGSGEGPRLLLVCPSKQFPLGVTMSLARRLALIDWARRHSAWIVEDDYDSEYRFDGKPIPSLQGLDGGHHVIYVGTFSKVLFPSLRLGFIVCPPGLVEPLVAARAISGRHGSVIEQQVLRRFIDDGHLARHVRRMRNLYRSRQEMLLEACSRHIGSQFEVERASSGLQTMAWLPPDLDDRRMAREAQALGVEVAPLTRFCLRHPRRPALVLGFGGFTEGEIDDAARRLGQIFHTTNPRRPR